MSKEEIELRFKADAAFLGRIQERTDKTPTEVARAALQFYNWATYQMENGRVIQARIDDGEPQSFVFIPEE